MEQLLYKYWLMRNEDVPYSRKQKLIEYFCDSYNIYFATKVDLIDSGLLDKKEAEIFVTNREKFDLVKEYQDFCHSPFSFVTMEDEDYPKKLLNIYDKPYGLFYVGKLPSFEKAISIVGARRCSAYGKRLSLEIGQKLGTNGYTVISGMARGVDAYGHKGCLEAGGTTVAVLGSGCDVIYPNDNRLLYEEIVSSGGAIISEYQMGTRPLAMNFPRRNRIVSALSDVVVVIEARDKSGSLITADFALEQGKDIFVTPGRIGDSLSYGTNKLIAQGAGIIYDTDQFISDMQSFYGVDEKAVSSVKKARIKLDADQKKVYNLFDDYPKSISTVLEESQMEYLKLLSVILSLERCGLLSEVFKNNYVKMG